MSKFVRTSWWSESQISWQYASLATISDFTRFTLRFPMQELKSAYVDDEDLQEQCIVFDEELENDAAELKNQTTSSRKRADVEDAGEEYGALCLQFAQISSSLAHINRSTWFYSTANLLRSSRPCGKKSKGLKLSTHSFP